MLSILTEHQFFPIVMKHNKYDYFRIMSKQASLSAVRWVLAWLSVRYLVIRDHNSVNLFKTATCHKYHLPD